MLIYTSWGLAKFEQERGSLIRAKAPGEPAEISQLPRGGPLIAAEYSGVILLLGSSYEITAHLIIIRQALFWLSIFSFPPCIFSAWISYKWQHITSDKICSFFKVFVNPLKKLNSFHMLFISPKAKKADLFFLFLRHIKASIWLHMPPSCSPLAPAESKLAANSSLKKQRIPHKCFANPDFFLRRISSC